MHPQPVIYLRAGSVHRDLNMVAVTGRCNISGHLRDDEPAVFEDGNPYPASDRCGDRFRNVITGERLTAAKGDIHDGTGTRFIHEPDPGISREFTPGICRAGKVKTVSASLRLYREMISRSRLFGVFIRRWFSALIR
jgi:hypothetical protein